MVVDYICHAHTKRRPPANIRAHLPLWVPLTYLHTSLVWASSTFPHSLWTHHTVSGLPLQPLDTSHSLWPIPPPIPAHLPTFPPRPRPVQSSSPAGQHQGPGQLGSQSGHPRHTRAVASPATVSPGSAASRWQLTPGGDSECQGGPKVARFYD